MSLCPSIKLLYSHLPLGDDLPWNMIFSVLGLKQYHNPHTPIEHSQNPWFPTHAHPTIHQVEVTWNLNIFYAHFIWQKCHFSWNEKFCTPLCFLFTSTPPPSISVLYTYSVATKTIGKSCYYAYLVKKISYCWGQHKKNL